MPKMRYFETRKGRVEIIPMIDVMLFLLVFFIIVTLQMIPDSGVALQLATSTAAEKLVHPKVVVNVMADGTIEVKGKTLDQAALTGLLRQDGDPAHTELTIAADKASAFQHFFTVMDAAARPASPTSASPPARHSPERLWLRPRAPPLDPAGGRAPRPAP